MPHLRSRVGIDALNRQSHDTPCNHNLSGGKTARIEHKCARRFLAQAASKRLCRKLGKKGVFVAQNFASGANRLTDARVAPCHHRHHPMAYIVAQVRNVLVAFIFPPWLTVHLQIAHELIVREVEQGANHNVPTARNAR